MIMFQIILVSVWWIGKFSIHFP